MNGSYPVTSHEPLGPSGASEHHRPVTNPLTALPTFDELFIREYPAMVALAAAVSGSRTHAEDIAQEALSRLDRNWDKVGGYAKPGAWLRRVTINLALSEKRRRVNELKALVRLRPINSSLPDGAVADLDVWEVVAQLPKMQRAVISLTFLEDRTSDEVGEILNISPATARVHLHRARKTLHERLSADSDHAHRRTSNSSTEVAR